tara:strand:+ start:97 stop:3351 length:3255 start_codon:yes stop_codon:yes gene_type:complete
MAKKPPKKLPRTSVLTDEEKEKIIAERMAAWEKKKKEKEAEAQAARIWAGIKEVEDDYRALFDEDDPDWDYDQPSYDTELESPSFREGPRVRVYSPPPSSEGVDEEPRSKPAEKEADAPSKDALTERTEELAQNIEHKVLAYNLGLSREGGKATWSKTGKTRTSAMPGLFDLKSGKKLWEAIEKRDKKQIDKAMGSANKEAIKKGGVLTKVRMPFPVIEQAVNLDKIPGDLPIPDMEIYDFVPLYGPHKEERAEYVNSKKGDMAFALWAVLRAKEDNTKVDTKTYENRGKEREMVVHSWDWDKIYYGPGRKPIGRHEPDRPSNDLVFKPLKKLSPTHWEYDGIEKISNKMSGRDDPLSLIMFGDTGGQETLVGDGHTVNSRPLKKDESPYRTTKTLLVASAPYSPWGGVMSNEKRFYEPEFRQGVDESNRASNISFLYPTGRKKKQPTGWNSPLFFDMRGNSRGDIPPEIALARFAEIFDTGMPHKIKDLKEPGRELYKGSRSHPRNMVVDLDRKAKIYTDEGEEIEKTFGGTTTKTGIKRMIPLNSPADQMISRIWYMLPNQVDMTGIDNLLGTESLVYLHTGSEKDGLKTFMIGTTENKQIAEKILETNFTESERRLMKEVIIDLTRPLGDSAGTHQQSYFRMPGLKKEREISLIRVDPNFLTKSVRGEQTFIKGPMKGNVIDDDTMTHEMIHYLRHKDESRLGATGRKSLGWDKSDRDIEEAMTDAESMGRSHMSPLATSAGYHQLIKDERTPNPIYHSPTQNRFNAFFSTLNKSEKAKLKRRLDKLPEDQREELRRSLMRKGSSPVQRGPLTHGSDPPERVRHINDQETLSKIMYDRLLMRNMIMPGDKKGYVETKDGEFSRESLENLQAIVPEVPPRLAAAVLKMDTEAMSRNSASPSWQRSLDETLTKKEQKEIRKKLLTPVRGKTVVERVREVFPHLNLARMSYHGDAEAIDTFWVTESVAPDGKSQKTFTHVYSPNPEEVTQAELIDIVDDVPTGPTVKVSEYRDGVLHPVKKMKAPNLPKQRAPKKAKASKGSVRGRGSKRPGSVKSYKDTATGRTYSRRTKGSMPKSKRFTASK